MVPVMPQYDFLTEAHNRRQSSRRVEWYYLLTNKAISADLIRQNRRPRTECRKYR
jgi:hypothetical protein